MQDKLLTWIERIAVGPQNWPKRWQRLFFWLFPVTVPIWVTAVVSIFVGCAFAFVVFMLVCWLTEVTTKSYYEKREN